jgi:hypothetical protein
MPRIFDNIEQDFVSDLRKSLSESTRADRVSANDERGGALLNCLRAFEKCDFPDDWRDLMQPLLIRRTRESVAAGNLFDSAAAGPAQSADAETTRK